ncbi:MAG: hypothetical protein JRD89_02480 [Deltaproteobacteria bacterium]|nr:hypothetical protein [Deltaproteobacteria bacterium]
MKTRPLSPSPPPPKRQCRWCGSAKVAQDGGADQECAACRSSASYHAWESPYNGALVKRDMAMAYRGLLGYGSGEPGPEQLHAGDDDGD